MMQFLKPPKHQPSIPEESINKTYTSMRLRVFLGAFIGYAGYYLIRKNFSLVFPDLIKEDYTKTDLGLALSAISIAYGLSKFFMGMISDKSDSRKFITLGLILSSITMIAMGFIPALTSSVTIMFTVLFINGWFQGMGWPPCGRIMAHWFSQNERGTKMAIWNIAHNVGGAFMPLIAILGVYLFSDWQSQLYFPAFVALITGFSAYWLIRDTPQSCGLPNIEAYRNDYPKSYQKSFEDEMSTKEILVKYIFNNKFLWIISSANAFIYMVRYGVLDWVPLYLNQVNIQQLTKET